MFRHIHVSRIVSYLRDFYSRFERPISSFSLIFGFIFDAVTLSRVDMLWENVWVVVHLFVVAVCIILINRGNMTEGAERDPVKLHFWLVNILQFFFGGILSTYLVFYFRSGALSVTWPFLLLLGLAFWANEYLKRQYVRLDFPIVLLYLSLFSFSIFIVPVVLHSIGIKTFLLSGVVSLVFMGIFLSAFSFFTGKLASNIKIISLGVLCIFILINGLYFTNLIPSIPLSLKDSGVYHFISRNTDGNYEVLAEPMTWRNFFILYDDFHATPNDFVFVYSAIFSPPQLNTTIVHHYQYYDESIRIWKEKDTVQLPVIGGRAGGFRTFSVKKGLALGRWRVLVETVGGQNIGTIRFTVVPTPPLSLETIVK